MSRERERNPPVPGVIVIGAIEPAATARAAITLVALALTAIAFAVTSPVGQVFAKDRTPKKPAAAGANPQAAPPVVGVSVERGPGWSRADITLDGPLGGLAWLRRAPGSVGSGLGLALLAEAAKPAESPGTGGNPPACAPGPSRNETGKKPGRAFVWNPAKPDALRRLPGDIPAGARLEAADLDGDGGDELIVLAERKLFGLGAFEGPEVEAAEAAEAGGGPPGVASRLRTLATDPALGVPEALFGRPAAPGDPLLRLSVLGGLRTYGVSGGGASAAQWGLLSEVPLPVEARRQGAEVVLDSPRVAMVPGDRRFVTAPQAVGTERLRIRLLDPQAAEGVRSLDCWAKLPGSERIVEWGVLALDGRPVMMVMTISAEKLSLFGEKMLRLFPLVVDRTRGGADPILAVETGMNLWQVAHPFFRDADGDGRVDLVLGYWKGITDSTLVLETYLRDASGGFRTRARTQTFDVKGGEHAFLDVDHDITGDGISDLLVAAEGKICVYAGVARPASPDALISKRATVCAPLPEGLNDLGDRVAAIGSGGFETGQQGGGVVPLVEDVDGDGRFEVIVALRAAGRVSVLRFD